MLKPSEQTPLSLLRFAELAQDVLPAGVLNVITGDGVPVGERLVTHPDVRLVSLTGDVSTGKLIARNAFIHGQVQGLVFAENVTIEKTGRVNGVIFCRNLTVFGKVDASIICDSIFVRTGGVMTSMLKYKNLRIEQGGAVGGKFEKRVVIDARAKPARPEGGLLRGRAR